MERNSGELVALDDVLPYLEMVSADPSVENEDLARGCAARVVRRAAVNGELGTRRTELSPLIDRLGDALVEIARRPGSARRWTESPSEVADLIWTRVSDRRLALSAETDGRRLLAELCSLVRQFGGRADDGFEAGYRAYVAARYAKLTVHGFGPAERSYELPLEIAYVGSVEQLLMSRQRAVLRGEAGSGKTTTLQWLAMRVADNAVRTPDGSAVLVPFFFSLRTVIRRGRMPTPDEFLSAIGCPLAEQQPRGWAARVLGEGRAVVLLDGLDEVSADEQRRFFDWLGEMLHTYRDNQWIMSCRPTAVPERGVQDFADVVLPPLTAAGAENLVRAWYRARLATDVDTEENSAYEESLLELLRSRADLTELASNPLMCAVLCSLNTAGTGALPGDRTSLYSGFLELLLHRRDGERGIVTLASRGLGQDQQLLLLGRLAHWMLRNGMSRMAHDDVVRQIDLVLPGPPTRLVPEEILAHLLERTGLLRSDMLGAVEFVHRSFQDFLAARALVVEADFPLLRRHVNDDQWRDVLLNAVGLARPRERGQLLTDLLQLGDAERERSAALRLYLLAAMCLTEASEVEPSVRQAVMDRIAGCLPPRSADEATDFAALGPTVLALLPEPAALSRAENRAFLDILVRIPGPEAQAAARRHSLPPHPAWPSALRRLPEPPPGARELAVALSVATRIEPELIRAVRLRVFPLLDVGDEADLWFSAWTAARTAHAMALRPELLPVLRAELAERLASAAPGDPIHHLGAIVMEVHEHISPALRVEERLNWLDVTGVLGSRDGEAIVGDLLSPALRALVEERREGVADWLSGAWSRLPEAARESVRAWQLVTAAAQQVPDAGLEQAPAPTDLTAVDVSVIVESVGDAVLTVARSRDTLTLGAGTGTAQDTGILVPDTDPRVVEVLVDEGGTEPVFRTVTVSPGEARTVSVGDGPVRLRTPRGDVYELAAAPDPPPPVPDGGTTGDVLRLEETRSGWCFRVSAGTLAAPEVLARIEREVRHARAVSPEGPLPRGELGQWRNGLGVLARALVDAGLRDVEVLIGQCTGPGDDPTDVMLAGENPSTGQLSYVVVELRGWRSLVVDRGDARLCRPGSKATRWEVNPQERARSRWAQLVATHDVLSRNYQKLTSVVFLPLAHDRDVDRMPQPLDGPGVPLFTGDQLDDFQEFLQSRLAPIPAALAADRLLFGRLLPRQTVLSAAVRFDREPPFSALGGQSAVLGHAMSALRRAERQVVVVTGPAGTGKTALALMLLFEARQTHPDATYASGLRAFASRLRMALGSGRARNADWVRFPFHVVPPDGDGSASTARLPLLVCDDAQFARARSNGRYIPPAERSDQPETERMMDSADVSVFLVDETSTWDRNHVGSAERILQSARDKGLPTVHVELGGPLRFGGSAAYPRWVAGLLGGTDEGAVSWQPDGRYDVLAADSPQEMEDFLRARLEDGNSVRMTAGLCWPWTVPADEEASDQTRGEVTVGEWRRPWQSPTPPGRWAVDASGVEQMGNIHGAAGFEFDWCGVLLGPDFVHRDGRWITVRSENQSTLLRTKVLPDAEADRLIRNAYRILLTRAARGVVLCSADPETRQALRALAPGTASGLFRPAGQ
ncbi:DNA/RNA helicase domain-containing protein [Streptomyces sp. STR69]|uniref:DNA/RNA helicase domain-containing protein n=1 Tax=Streptomyces sp. STR69 TaxID=1796942 RepID=UPI0021C9B41F|nr:DNA/RNA helicase domain-containing protein [Streptomyces sp. STR69]